MTEWCVVEVQRKRSLIECVVVSMNVGGVRNVVYSGGNVCSTNSRDANLDGCVRCCGQCVSVCGCVGLRAVCICVWLRGCVWQARLAWKLRMKMGLRDEDSIADVVANLGLKTSI